jgi:hypothetical protein
MDLDRLTAGRPYLYHLTAASNLRLLGVLRALFPASQILREAGEVPLVRLVRRGPHKVRWRGGAVELRDQDPFHAGNVAFDPGWGEGDVVELLNARVYFWPGSLAGPIDYGVRHFQRYASQDPAVLRIPFTDLLASNPTITPELCAYNSGAPRCSGGKKSPRGAFTFVAPSSFGRPAGAVVEVTFPGSVTLPGSTLVARGLHGPWEPLAASADRSSATPS